MEFEQLLRDTLALLNFSNIWIVSQNLHTTTMMMLLKISRNNDFTFIHSFYTLLYNLLICYVNTYESFFSGCCMDDVSLMNKPVLLYTQ